MMLLAATTEPWEHIQMQLAELRQQLAVLEQIVADQLHP